MGNDRKKDGFVRSAHKVHIKMVEMLKDNDHSVEKPLFSESTTYDINGNRIEEACYNADGTLSFKNVFSYEGERLKEIISYTGADIYWGKTSYRYDAQGRMLEESFYNECGERSRHKLFNYGRLGKRVEEFFFNAGPGDVYEVAEASYNTGGASLIVSAYDANDKLTEVLFYNDDRLLLFKIILTYDAERNLVEDVQYTGNTFLRGMAPEVTGLLPVGTVLFRRTYLYNMQKKRIEENLYLADSLNSKKVFIYDPEGYKIEETEYGPDGAFRSKTKFSYEFNSFREWIKQTTSPLSTESNAIRPVIVTYRTILYY